MQEKPQKDHDEMPEIAVQSQDREAVMHAGLVGEGKDAGQQAEVRKEVCEGPNHEDTHLRFPGAAVRNCAADTFGGFGFLCSPAAALSGQKKLPQGQQIERHAAELERKIPPEVRAAVSGGQQKLLPDLGEREQDGENIQQKILFWLCQAAGRESGQPGEEKTGQEDEHGMDLFRCDIYLEIQYNIYGDCRNKLLETIHNFHGV